MTAFGNPGVHQAMPPTRRRTILVVDDEPAVLTAVADQCEALGYRVFRAVGGVAALPYLSGTIDLLITDVRRPGLDGLGLLRLVRAVLPALPVIAMTGYPDFPELGEMTALGLVGILRKPFRLPELQALIAWAWPAGGPAPVGPGAERRRVLVADDEPAVREAFETALEGMGHTVTLAKDGLEALEILRQEPVDVIFLDVLLPAVGGAAVIEAVRQCDPQVPVVLITGYPDHAETLAAQEHGPAMLLPKPIRVADIEAALKIVFKERPPS